MKRLLTENQVFVIQTLEKRGADFTANATRRAWENGTVYYLDSRLSARRGLVRRMNQGNKEALGIFKKNFPSE